MYIYLYVTCVSNEQLRFHQKDLHEQMLCSMLCACWLMEERYDLFTACQADDVRLSTEHWSSFVSLKRWANLDHEMLDACLLFLSIRGLGKVHALERFSSSSEAGNPEITLRNLLSSDQDFVKSLNRLSQEMRQIVIDCSHLYLIFNLGQFVQAENLPSAFRALEVAESGRQAERSC